MTEEQIERERGNFEAALSAKYPRGAGAANSEAFARYGATGRYAWQVEGNYKNSWMQGCWEGWSMRADIARQLEAAGWLLIMEAPNDGTPIIGWCIHDADPRSIDEGERLTPYGIYCEGISHVPDGAHVIHWVEGYMYRESPESEPYEMPGWWFLADGRGNTPANPTHFMPIKPFPSEPKS